jgi:uncharacterized protein (DUF2237 family)
MTASLNVYGKSLENCSCNPMTGYSVMVFVIRYQRIQELMLFVQCDKMSFRIFFKKRNDLITQS